MIDVFISYKRDDRNDARAIAETLVADGYEVWWDILLLPGDRFRDEIVTVLENAKAVVVLWSKEALKSDFVVDEAQLANKLGKYIPMSLDGSMPPIGLRNVNCPSLLQWRINKAESELKGLRDAIRVRVGEPRRKSSFVTQNINQTMEATLWKTVTEIEDASPAQRIESLDVYLDRFGADGLFSTLARRLKVDPSSRRRYDQADQAAIDAGKRPLNTNRIRSNEDLVSIRIDVPKGASSTDATLSPDANNIIVAYQESPKGTFETLNEWVSGKNLDYRHLHEYRLRDGLCVDRFGEFEEGVKTISLSPDGKRLALVDRMNTHCLIMEMATKATTRVGTGIQDSTVRWSADSKRCLFEFEWNSRNVNRKVLLRPDGSVKEVEGLNSLYECVIRDSWLAVARDAVVEIDHDLVGHPSEVFVLDRTNGKEAQTRLAVSPSGTYVAIAQRLGDSKFLRIAIYDSTEWSRLGLWEVEQEFSVQPYWLSDKAILTKSSPSSRSEYEIRRVPELQVTHSFKMFANCVLPCSGARPAYGIFTGLFSTTITTLGYF